ncbi:hypothetical protein GE09DRAFT_1157986 [Coniochaeta sp. 2T2.1]|nr:hypothetical protein GE09DRAFT_1157986 [Coniochaeta sp. 2T2.1]
MVFAVGDQLVHVMFLVAYAQTSATGALIVWTGSSLCLVWLWPWFYRWKGWSKYPVRLRRRFHRWLWDVFEAGVYFQDTLFLLFAHYETKPECLVIALSG